MRVTLSQPLISCTRRISIPYSSPASMNVKYCSLLSAADLSAPATAFAILISAIPPQCRCDSAHVFALKPADASCGVRAAAGDDGSADEVRNVDNQRYRAVAENGRAGNSRHRLEVRLQTLDDDLLLRQKIVDEDTSALAVRFDD